MQKPIYIKFFPKDWQADSALRLCSLQARGLWIELLCIMAQSERCGVLDAGGEPMQRLALIRLVGCTEAEFDAGLEELERNNVIKRDEHGFCYSKRMMADYEKTATAIEYGKRGGNPALKRRKGATKKEPEREASPRIEDPELEAQVALAEPLPPPITEAEAIARATIIGLSEAEARKCWNYYQSEDWLTKSGTRMSRDAAFAKLAKWKVNKAQFDVKAETLNLRLEAARAQARRGKAASVHVDESRAYKFDGE